MFLVARLAFGVLPRGRTTLSLFAAVIGGIGAASLLVVGTSMSEAIPNIALFGAILLFLRADAAARAGRSMAGRYAAAGVLAGAAAVLKLTTMPYPIGIGGAIILMKLLEPGLPRLLALGAGVALSFVVLGGPWWLAVYRAFGNPLYPYRDAVSTRPTSCH